VGAQLLVLLWFPRVVGRAATVLGRSFGVVHSLCEAPPVAVQLREIDHNHFRRIQPCPSPLPTQTEKLKETEKEEEKQQDVPFLCEKEKTRRTMLETTRTRCFNAARMSSTLGVMVSIASTT
jgi:hypothetical protein